MPINYNKIKNLTKEIPFKFKPQSVKWGKALMVAYIDNRDVQDVLDDVVGPENWTIDYKLVGTQMFATIGINILYEDGKSEWVYKSDGGTESNTEQEKGLISDCAKRTAVTWGIGRFLYRQGVIELKTTKDSHGKERPATDAGEILWSNDAITQYIRQHKLSNAASKKTKGERYEKAPDKPKYTTPSWNEETVEKVKVLEKNGKKGKACLSEFLPQYNKSKNTEYKLIAELNTDELLLDLIKFIENSEPDGI